MADLSFEIVEGPDAGRVVAVDRPLLVGRAEDADFILSDGQVSRHHAKVVPTDGGVATVEDLGSSNGTFVNTAPLHGVTRISPGDELLVGLTVLQLRSSAQIRSEPSAVRPLPPALAVAERRPTFVDPVSSGREQGLHPELQALRDNRVRFQARTAPLAIFVLVALVVAIYLAAS